MKKRPVALLEVLIALTLLTLCSSQLVLRPIRFHRAATEQLERIEYDRIAAWTFSEIKESLLKNELRWSQVPPLQQEGPWISLPQVPLQLPQLSHSVPRKYRLKTLREKISDDGQIYRLVAVHMKIKDRQFTYDITLNKSPLAQM